MEKSLVDIKDCKEKKRKSLKFSELRFLGDSAWATGDKNVKNMGSKDCTRAVYN